MEGLTAKQRRFVEEYMVDLNATQAAIRAGYSKETARQMGTENLSKPYIADAIAEKQKEQSKRLEITADRVLQEFAKIGFANMADYMKVTSEGDPFLDLSELTREQAAAISEVTTEDYTEGRGEDSRNVRKIKMKLHSKENALTQIGRHLGMFTDKTEHSFDLSGLTDEEVKLAKRIFGQAAETQRGT